MSRTWLRWVPAAVVPAVVAAYALAGPALARAAVDLPDKTPEQVLAMIGHADVPALSGTLEQTSHLGLPELPDGGPAGSGGAASALELLTGTHTARVYLDGPTNARIQVMDSLAERDVVRRGNEVWFYSSQSLAATHLTLPAGVTDKAHPTPPADAPTPAQLAQLAQHFVTAIEPSTRVTVEKDVTVAGRSAYELVLAPRAAGTLIGSVAIAVDAETGLPLRVTVAATGQNKPAFQLGFISLSLTAPPAARFEFTPPAGATVTQQALPQGTAEHRPAEAHAAEAAPESQGHGLEMFGTEPTVLGSGWDAILVLPTGALPAEVTSSPLFAQVTRAYAGGHALHTALVNVFVASDGRVLVGSVPLERLRAAAVGQ